MSERIVLLVVEDDRFSYMRVERFLQSIPSASFEIVWAQSCSQASDRLSAQEFDVCLVDYQLPDGTGTLLIREINKNPLAPPCIMLTSQEGYQTDLEAMQAGAVDYLTKDRLEPETLERSIRYALKNRRVEAALRESQERYALVVRGANDGVWDWNPQSGRLYLSTRWKDILGYRDEEFEESMEHWFSRVHPDDLFEARTSLDDYLSSRLRQLSNEYRMRHKDGHWVWVRVKGQAVFDAEGKAVRVAGSMGDITERRQALETLRIREQERELRLQRMEEELRMARTIQKQFLPRIVPAGPGFRFSAIYQPAEMVGGDLYDFYMEETACIGFICDVSGHGVPSALISGLVKATFEDAASMDGDPGSILTRMNGLLHDKMGTYFLTAACFRYDQSTRDVTLASAGHNPLLLVRDGRVEELVAHGRVVGPFPEYVYATETWRLEPGDRILAYTDGINECVRFSPVEEMYGDERLMDFLAEKTSLDGEQFLQVLLDTLGTFSGNAPFEDDVTAIVLDIE